MAATWDEALAAAKPKADGRQAGRPGLARLTNEELAAFGKLLPRGAQRRRGRPAHGAVPSLGLGGLPANVASLDDVDKSDCIVVVGGDPLVDQKVLGYVARRAADDDGKLIVVNDQETGLTALATDPHAAEERGQGQEGGRGGRAAGGALRRRPEGSAYAALRALPTKTRFLPLVEGANAVGAAKAGLSARAVGGDALLIFAGDEQAGRRQRCPRPASWLAMAAYEGKWLKGADVVLPAQVWTEKSGHVTNMEGREIAVVPFTTPPEGIPADEATLAKLQKEIG